MGCNCGGTKDKTTRLSSLARAKQLVRKVWEDTNNENNQEKTTTVRKIIRKTNHTN